MRSRTPNERGCLGQIQDLRKGGILEFGSVFITGSLLPKLCPISVRSPAAE
jgi:hypothetical protein